MAALLVVFFHMNTIWIKLVPDGSHSILNKAYLMVDLFFIISGFIMVYVYGHQFQNQTSGIDFKRFIQSRFARVYPLHFFSLLVLIVYYLVEIKNKEPNPFDSLLFDLSAIPGNLFLLQGMGIFSFFNWNVPSWSISTEWWVYLLFPFLMRGLFPLTPKKQIGLFLFILLGYLVCQYWVYPYSSSVSPMPSGRGFSLDLTYDFGFFRCLLGFLLGMLLHPIYTSNFLKSLLSSPTLFLVVYLACGISLYFGVTDFALVFLFALLVLVTLHSKGFAEQLLLTRPLQFLGNISYSVYLMHLPLLVICMSLDTYFPGLFSFLPRGWPLAAGFGLILLLISMATYSWIEQPLRGWLAPAKPR